MTCEVVCLNHFGAAICADSAVSLSRNGKAYTGVQKIVPLGEKLPAALMIFGNADFVGVPWSLVLETFASTLDGEEAEHLEIYCSRLISFLESDHQLLSGKVEVSEYVRWAVEQGRAFLRSVDPAFGGSEIIDEEAWEALRAALRLDESRPHTASPRLGDAFGDSVISAYSSAEGRVVSALFGAALPPDDLKDALFRLLSRRAGAEHLAPSSTGIVIVGFGRADFLPRLLELRVESRLFGRLRYARGTSSEISTDNRSCIATFAQSEMAEAFLHGMTINAWAEVESIFLDVLEDTFGDSSHGGPTYSVRQQLADEVSKRLLQYMHEEYTRPLEDAAALLPMSELARLAQTLVSLAAFRSQLSVVETGTVGGELHVCTITKHQGFRWISQ